MEDNKNDFVRETIKEKPVNKKRIWQRVGLTAGCALVFALIFCIVTALLLPFILEKRGISLSKIKENDTQQNSVPVTETEPDTSTEVVIDPIVPDQMTIDTYQHIQSQLYNIGTTANRSVVIIRSVTSKTNWFNDSYDASGEGSGIIVSQNSSEYLILTEQKLIHDASSVFVTFIDDTEVSASVCGVDSNTGLAILSVDKGDVSKATSSNILVASFAENDVSTGSLVIAVGSPVGNPYSILTGTVTDMSLEASCVDCNYKLFSTDIISNSGSGVLINTSGQIVGVVMQALSETTGENVLSAIPVSQLTNVIENAAKGKGQPYIGLSLVTVTGKINTETGLPFGAFVKKIDENSPAAIAMLQEGDVVVELNGESVTSVQSYTEALQSCKSGDTVSLVVKRLGTNGYSEIAYDITIGEK